MTGTYAQQRCPCCMQPLPAGVDWTPAGLVPNGAGRVILSACIMNPQGVTYESLIHMLWPGDRENKLKNPENSLRVYISRCRRALEADGRWTLLGNGSEQRPLKVRRIK